MAFPTLPASWSAPSSCYQSTAIWGVVWSTDANNIYWDWNFGVPATTPTGPCLPPSYATSAPYLGTTCPGGFANAGVSATTLFGQAASATLCCPGTGLGFSSGGYHEGCQSAFGSSSVTATLTYSTLNTATPTIVVPEAGDFLPAFAITITPPASSTPPPSTSPPPSTASSTASTTSPTTTQTTSPSSSKLSAGATAGIGVGAAVGVVLLFLLGWCLYRRRSKKTTPDDPPAMNESARYFAEPSAPPTSPPDIGPKSSPVPVPSSPGVASTVTNEYYQQQQHGYPSPSSDHRLFSELPSEPYHHEAEG
ncbi:hypothetical protein F5Y16DRAFT_423389 [Xylariaceae sp. FL0255]|nr:hypothetical protein F5Y16DRAFT_423389 [Xylariaceae sp. FL0255]